MKNTGGVLASEKTWRRVSKMLEENGVVDTAKYFEVGREVILRVAARHPVRRGSLALIETKL